MDKNKYIKNTIRKIQCNSSKKKDIRKQLETDIDIKLEQGQPIEDIILEMGSPKEIADSFNENLSDSEKRKYHTRKILKILIPIVIAFAVIIGLLYSLIPKTTAIENSRYFDMTQLENTMQKTIVLLDNKDYESLQAMSTERMKSVFTEDIINDAKSHISDNFGQRISYGTFYAVEVTQYGKHYAVGEISVSYENVSVTYRLTYDENMKLSGFYMR